MKKLSLLAILAVIMTAQIKADTWDTVHTIDDVGACQYLKQGEVWNKWGDTAQMVSGKKLSQNANQLMQACQEYCAVKEGGSADQVYCEKKRGTATCKCKENEFYRYDTRR